MGVGCNGMVVKPGLGRPKLHQDVSIAGRDLSKSVLQVHEANAGGSVVV